MDKKISDEYRVKGIDGFYQSEGEFYRNPHEFAIVNLLEKALSKMKIKRGRALDLACGSGEATIFLESNGFSFIDGVDPYTHKAYKKRTGRKAEQFSFQDIAQGVLSGRKYDVVVCSFALHLLDESWLPRLCYNLSTLSKHLIILTPIKRPEIKKEWGWELDFEILEDRVRVRVYSTVNVKIE